MGLLPVLLGPSYRTARRQAVLRAGWRGAWGRGAFTPRGDLQQVPLSQLQMQSQTSGTATGGELGPLLGGGRVFVSMNALTAICALGQAGIGRTS